MYSRFLPVNSPLRIVRRVAVAARSRTALDDIGVLAEQRSDLPRRSRRRTRPRVLRGMRVGSACSGRHAVGVLGGIEAAVGVGHLARTYCSVSSATCA